MKGKTLLSAIYFHPEAYPPTLNAAEELSKVFDWVYILHRPHLKNEWVFRNNVELVSSGEPMTVVDQEQSSIYRKIGFFLRYTRKLYQLIRNHKPAVVQLYDTIPLFSFYLIRRFLGYRPVVWYHNHDVAEIKLLRKLSIGWFAAYFEDSMFPALDFFTLPSEERKEFFPIARLKGTYFFIPNLPSWTFYSQFANIEKDKSSVRVLFQGSLGPGHGIEEIMNLMPLQINGKPIRLILKGFLKDPFKQELHNMIESKSLIDHVEIHGVTSYKDVPKLTASCHIGIAIFTKDDIMNKTLGTASNKIYEYAACGLPILYHDDEYYRAHLSHYKWAVPVDLSVSSLKKALEFIDSNYQELSDKARSDIENNLKFESKFSIFSEDLIRKIDQKLF